MGSVYASLLGDAGNEIWAIDVWKEHIEAIKAHGLRVEGASGDRTTKPNATTDPADAGICDLVVVATKAGQVADAAKSLQPLLGTDTVVLTIQNGLGAAERIAQHVPSERVLIGVAGGFGASMKGPGHAHHNGMELIRLGEMNGSLTTRLGAIETVWRDAGFNVKSFDDINQLVWEKFICNVTFSGPCTVLQKTVGEVMGNAYSWKIALGCGLEAYRAGQAKGVNFSFDDPEDYIRKFGEAIPNARPSMLLDHLARRPSEIDAINGMVPKVAMEAGINAPINEVITALVMAKEAEFKGH